MQHLRTAFPASRRLAITAVLLICFSLPVMGEEISPLFGPANTNETGKVFPIEITCLASDSGQTELVHASPQGAIQATRTMYREGAPTRICIFLRRSNTGQIEEYNIPIPAGNADDMKYAIIVFQRIAEFRGAYCKNSQSNRSALDVVIAGNKRLIEGILKFDVRSYVNKNSLLKCKKDFGDW